MLVPYNKWFRLPCWQEWSAAVVALCMLHQSHGGVAAINLGCGMLLKAVLVIVWCSEVVIKILFVACLH